MEKMHTDNRVKELKLEMIKKISSEPNDSPSTVMSFPSLLFPMYPGGSEVTFILGVL